ncbi:MAG: hypothetical protein P8163_16015 [Candidatus Thiodiazotropha sp.]
MGTLKDFGDSAKALSKNPLGIIALFIVLIYGFAALLVGSSSQIGAEERYPIVWFLVIFPVIVLAVFGWLVSQHYEKLYAPRDYNSDEALLKVLQDRKEARPGLKELDNQIGKKIKTALSSEDLLPDVENRAELREKLKQAAESITNEIRSTSFITIDARQLTGSDEDVFEFPESAFSQFSDLTDEIYFLIENHVCPYEYGYSWVIRDPSDGHVIKNARMISGTKSGVPLTDERSLSEVGIRAGMVLEVVKP